MLHSGKAVLFVNDICLLPTMEILDRSDLATQIMAMFRERENGQLETSKILAKIGCTREGLNHVLQQLIEGRHIKRGVYQRLDNQVKAAFVLSS